MNLLQIILIIIIFIFVSLIIIRTMNKPIVVKKYYTPRQHPIYPFVQYDIREVLAPSRRQYYRYPYYFHRNGILLR